MLVYQAPNHCEIGAAQVLCHTEIEKLDHGTVKDLSHDIAGFNVPMHNAGFVGFRQCIEDLLLMKSACRGDMRPCAVAS